ncbi:polysaccharide lyase [Gilvimarinus polysaccharolyticus]|uniref:polysaccharide lyase n=1 Tax=Gilvimarinus polysaccharolyticus TaxID=863921 RepID=UPI000673B5E2|nr:hypothetical protein [Gilvimarinus polysaccharolyticus]
MIRYLSLKLLLLLVLAQGLLINSIQAEIIYSNGFESLSLGKVNDRAIKQSWDTRYAKGPDEGRVEIVTDSNSGKAAKITYPAYSNQSTPSGATWETNLSQSRDEMYMSYWVKFDHNFDFVKGGKMPGLGGATNFPYGDNGFTTRLMWREQGKLEFYVHGYEVNNSNGAEPYRIFWDDAGYHAKVVPGQWHHIEIRQKLNTPGQRDGILQGWLDGELVCDDTDNTGVRALGHSNTQLNHLYFSTFFGGSSAPVTQWQPTSDVYAIYDDFIVSSNPIGMNALPNSGNASSSSSTAGSSSSSSSSSSTNGNCMTIPDGSGKHEINLYHYSCLQFTSNLAGKTFAVWDSDAQPSCDFRGSIQSVDGSGSVTVPDNYQATNSLTGTKLNINASNGCNYLKVRAL